MRRRVTSFTTSLVLHVAAMTWLVWTSAVTAPPPPPVKTRTVMLEWPLALLVEQQEAKKDQGARDRPREVPDLAYDASETTIAFDGFTYDFKKVTDRARSLFPFLSVEVSIEPLLTALRSERTPKLVSPYASMTPDSQRTPLAMEEAVAQTFVNQAWARRERWAPFQAIAQLTSAYHLDNGDLPAVVRRYVDQNFLQPYVETVIPDPRLWTMLGIAADHTDFIDFVTQFVTEHPSTRTTTELLFMLDQAAQGSRDALIALLDTPVDKKLAWTEKVNREAHGFLRMVHQYYGQRTADLGLVTRDAIRLYYDTLRIAILKAIVDTTPGGYRASDARFLVGSIYWQQGRRGEALSWWRALAVDGTDIYHRAYAPLLAIIEGRGLDAIPPREVNWILDAERSRWRVFWIDRLKQFGHRFDTY